MASSIMIDLDDARSVKIAEVLSNKTSKKILQNLAEGEKCGSELADEMKIPLNTVTYNLKKLTEAGLIEKTKGFFWSSKGKKMDYYKVSNKRIVISPRRMIKGVVPAIFVSALAAVGVKLWTDSRIASFTYKESDMTATALGRADEMAVAAGEAAESAGVQAVDGVVAAAQSAWLWFFVGALTALLVYLIWNLWRQNEFKQI